jgi:hypothetical protein
LATRINRWNVNTGTTSISLAVSPATIGNVLVFATGGSGNNVGPAISGGGVTTWTKAFDFFNATWNGTYSIWYGRVTATGSSTITGTYAAVTDDLICEEFAPVNPSYVWSSAAGTGLYTVVSSSSPWAFNWPSLTSPASGDSFYWGFAGIDHSPGGTTSGAGFTFANTQNSNWVCYNPSLANNTAYQPSASESFGPGNAIAVGIILTDTAPVITTRRRVQQSIRPYAFGPGIAR